MSKRLKWYRLALIIMIIIVNSKIPAAIAKDGNVYNNISGDGNNAVILNNSEVFLDTLNVFLTQSSGEYAKVRIGEAVADTSMPPQVVDVKNSLRGWNGHNYQYVLFGEYDQKDGYKEPIMWRVLFCDKKKALLLSEYVLATKPFDNNQPIWEGSDIKAWLNSSFYNSAFNTQSEQSCIVEDIDRGAVFLLSKNDYLTSDYGFSTLEDADDARRARGSAYAVNHNLWTSSSAHCSYYTRTTGSGTTIWQIRANGSMGGARYDRDNVGIRPAIWVDLERITFNAGNGSWEYPFQKAADSI